MIHLKRQKINFINSGPWI